ncbi:DUF3558 domain-containing protein [Nocardia sp. NBC_01503]|uniref:DUF3558 family protein n=1 Tax=Nocardia sp. NBC_01503 TaxID=2975997 RepID=UPI002E7C3A6D|nr:DUF3558 family protein [Nocardia sp. NBC_01503]WTL33278.1 DUF3558 domain-containing protein [Nocardia sp. NBC_01503]
MITASHTRRRAMTILTAAATLIALVSGCTRNTDTATPPAPQWDPCTAFPEPAMQSIGMTDKSEEGTTGMRCSWSGPTGYRMDVWYHTNGADWKLGAEDITDATIGAYQGHTYHLTTQSHPYFCALQLQTRAANIVFEVTNSLHKDEDPCAVATRAATALEGYLPPVN